MSSPRVDAAASARAGGISGWPDVPAVPAASASASEAAGDASSALRPAAPPPRASPPLHPMTTTSSSRQRLSARRPRHLASAGGGGAAAGSTVEAEVMPAAAAAASSSSASPAASPPLRPRSSGSISASSPRGRMQQLRASLASRRSSNASPTPSSPGSAHSGSGTSVGSSPPQGPVASFSVKDRTAVNSSMIARAARESNLNSSLTGYLQNQLSLYAKRGHAREVLKILESARQRAVGVAGGGKALFAAGAQHSQQQQRDWDQEEAFSLAGSSHAAGGAMQAPGMHMTDEQRLFHGFGTPAQQQLLRSLPSGKGGGPKTPRDFTPAHPPRAHMRLASEVFAPLRFGGGETKGQASVARAYARWLAGGSGIGDDLDDDAIDESDSRAASRERQYSSLPSGSSNPNLPPLPPARLNLPSEHWGANNGVASAPMDSLAARARAQYAELDAQASYVRGREEKEDSSIRSLLAAVSQSSASTDPALRDSWNVPACNHAVSSSDGLDLFGRKLMAGLATEQEQAARFARQADNQRHGDPVPHAPALKSFVAAYGNVQPRDYRPAVASGGSGSGALSSVSSQGAELNSALDYDMLCQRREWSRMLRLAREEQQAKDRAASTARAHDEATTKGRARRGPKSYLSTAFSPGSQSARGPTSSSPSSSELPLPSLPPSQSTLANPPLPSKSFRRNRTALAYRLNDFHGQGGAKGLYQREQKQQQQQQRSSATGRSSSQFASASPSSGVLGSAGTEGLLPPGAPQPPIYANLYSTAGFTSSDYSSASGFASAAAAASAGGFAAASAAGSEGAMGSYSATGGFQRLQLTQGSAVSTMGGSGGEHHASSTASGRGAGSDADALQRWKIEMSSFVPGTPSAIGAAAGASSSPSLNASLDPSSSTDSSSTAAAADASAVPSLSSLLDFSDRNGSTPLFHCSWEGFTSVLTLLLEGGASVNVRNLRRHTAMDMAVERSQVECVKIMLRFGSDSSRSEARAARKRCAARLGATYGNWIKRMQSAGFMTASGDLVDSSRVSLPNDPESAHLIPMHQEHRRVDREILELFEHTVFYPPPTKVPGGENSSVAVGLGVLEGEGAEGVNDEATTADIDTVLLPPITHLTREARLHRRNKLRKTREDASRARARFLAAAGLAPGEEGGLGAPLASMSPNEAGATENEAQWIARKSILHLLPRAQGVTANSGSNVAVPVASAAGSSTDPASSPQFIEQDVHSLQSHFASQRLFFVAHARAVVAALQRKREEYSPLEKWVDALELYHSVCAGDLNHVVSILTHHPEHSSFQAHGGTMLFHACFHGHYEVARALLAAAVEHRLEREVERAARKTLRLETDGASDATDASLHEEDLPLSDRPALFCDPLESHASRSASLLQSPVPLDVNFLCLDPLRSQEQHVADQSVREGFEHRAANRALRRMIGERKAAAREEKARERERKKALNLSDSESEDEAEAPANASAPLSAAQLQAASEAAQRAADDAIDSPTALHPALQVWHKWVVDPRAWNRALARRQLEEATAKRMQEAAVAVSQGAAWNSIEETKQHGAALMRQLEQEQAADELNVLKHTEARAKKATGCGCAVPSEPDRYETALFVALRRKHYGLALLLHHFGAASPYDAAQLLALIDVQLRARHIMDAIRAQQYGALSSALYAATQARSTRGGGSCGNGSILQQVLAYQETSGANALLLCIQLNDLRAMELLKHATHMAGGTQGTSGANVAGNNMLNKLLQSVKDRLGYSAIDNSLLNAGSSSNGTSGGSGSSPPSSSSAPGSDGSSMTSFLLSQGGLSLTTHSILELVLQQEEGGAGGSGGMVVNAAGVEKLRKILQRSTAPGGAPLLGAVQEDAPSTPNASSAGASPRSSPRSSGVQSYSSMLGGSASTAAANVDVINFPDLYAALESSSLLRPEQAQEVRELLRGVEEEHANMKLARGKALQLHQSKRALIGSAGASPASAPRASTRSVPLALAELDFAAAHAQGGMDGMEVVLEGSESDADLLSAVRRSGQASVASLHHSAGGSQSSLAVAQPRPVSYLVSSSSALLMDEDSSALADESMALQAALASLDAAEARARQQGQEQKQRVEKIRQRLAQGVQGSEDDSSSEDEFAPAGKAESVGKGIAKPSGQASTSSATPAKAAGQKSADGADSASPSSRRRSMESSRATRDDDSSSSSSSDAEREDDADNDDGGEIDENEDFGVAAEAAAVEAEQRAAAAASKRGSATTAPTDTLQRKASKVSDDKSSAALASDSTAAPSATTAAAGAPTLSLLVTPPSDSLLQPRPRTPPPAPDILTLDLKMRLVWMLEDIESSEAVEAEMDERGEHLSASSSAASLERTSGGRANEIVFPSPISSPASSSFGRSPLTPAIDVSTPTIASAVIPQPLIDVTMLKWNNLLRVNPHIAPLLGVDFPTDKVRWEEPIAPAATSAPVAAETKAAAPIQASVPMSTATSNLMSSLASPRAVANSRAWKRSSLVEHSIEDQSTLVLPAVHSPLSAARALGASMGVGITSADSSHPGSPRIGSPPALGGAFPPVVPQLPLDPPLRTVTIPAWLEAFRRLACEKGLQAVHRVIEEFARISAVAQQEVEKQRERKREAKEEAKRQATGGGWTAGPYGFGSNKARWRPVQTHAQQQAASAATVASARSSPAASPRSARGALSRVSDARAALQTVRLMHGADVQFDEDAFAGSISSAARDGEHAAAHDSVVAFVPHLDPAAATVEREARAVMAREAAQQERAVGQRVQWRSNLTESQTSARSSAAQ